MKGAATLATLVLGAAAALCPVTTLASGSEDLAGALRILDAWVDTTVAQRSQPGLSMGVVIADQLVWSKGYGYADVAKRIPATPSTLYPIGSITKSFTAVSILQLRDAHRLKLDDALHEHLSWTHIRGAAEADGTVTLRTLLTHTGGLARELPDTVWSPPVSPSAESLHGDLEQVMPASTQWKYSNLGFALLGEVVAQAAGEPWDHYVRRHVLDPLGMSDTQPVLLPGPQPLAVGYARPNLTGPFVPVEYAPVRAAAPAAGVVSNVQDLARYLEFQIGARTGTPDPVLAVESLHEMQRPQWLFEDWQAAYGFGLGVQRVDGRTRVGHNGAWPGYRAAISFIPSLGIGVVVLTNSDEGNPVSYTDYALQLLAPILAREKARGVSRSVPNSQQFWGRYHSLDRRLTRIVALLDGELSLLAPDANRPYSARLILQPTSTADAFVMGDPAGAASGDAIGERMDFERDRNGRIVGFHTGSYRYVREP